jgi:hypothetical protein
MVDALQIQMSWTKITFLHATSQHWLESMIAVRGEQKNQKTDKPRKPEKNNRKNRTEKKPIKFLKKPAALVRFRFYKQKTKKTEPNRNETDKKSEKNRAKPKKPSQTEKNRAKTRKNRAKPV